MAQMVSRVQQDYQKVKVASDMKDLKIQELTFSLTDANNRVNELEQKVTFHQNMIDKLKVENTQFEEEIHLMKKENQRDAKSDTQRADLREKYNALLQENKALQKQIEAKFSADRFSEQQQLSEAQRDNSLLEAKNK